MGVFGWNDETILYGTHFCAFFKTHRIIHIRVISAACKLKKQNQPGIKDGMQTLAADLTVLQMNDTTTLAGRGRDGMSSRYGKAKVDKSHAQAVYS